MSTPFFPFPVRLSEKYRPRRISEFVGLDRPKRIASKFVAHPYDCSFIFYGPPGVGKTSLAQAMAEEMNGEFHHIGSQKCTLEELERVCRICAYVPMEGKRFHFVLIDEIDSASRAAQLALLSKLDSTEAPKQVVWVFTSNTVENLEPRERSLIAERVRAGLRNARAKGKRLGRPRVVVDAARVGRLHAQGRSIREIADELGYSRSLVHKTLANGESGRVANAAS